MNYQNITRFRFFLIWGGKRTDFENLQKGVPQHLKGEMKEAGKELIKEGFLLPKHTNYGLHVSLNPRLKYEIQHFIENNLDKL